MMDRPPLMPVDTPDYMAPAWASCLSWAICTPEIVARFRAETGNKWQPGKTPLARAIDDATGAGDEFCRAFTEWFNANVWGPMDGGEE